MRRRLDYLRSAATDSQPASARWAMKRLREQGHAAHAVAETLARLDVQRNSDKANLLLAHGWRVLHFTLFHLTRRARYVVNSVQQELVVACPA